MQASRPIPTLPGYSGQNHVSPHSSRRLLVVFELRHDAGRVASVFKSSLSVSSPLSPVLLPHGRAAPASPHPRSTSRRQLVQSPVGGWYGLGIQPTPGWGLVHTLLDIRRAALAFPPLAAHAVTALSQLRRLPLHHVRGIGAS
jgi:hypothetical protein